MNNGLIKAAVTTIGKNVSMLTMEDLTAMRETIRAEIANRKPVKAGFPAGTGKRGRPAKYATAEEKKQAIEAKRKQKMQERNAALEAEGKPIPKRGRPRKALNLCDIICP